MRFNITAATALAVVAAMTLTTVAAPLNSTIDVVSTNSNSTTDLGAITERDETSKDDGGLRLPVFAPDPSQEDGLQCWHNVVDTQLYIAVKSQCYSEYQYCYKEYLHTMRRLKKYCKLTPAFTVCDTPEILPDVRDIDYCANLEITNYEDIALNRRPDKIFEDRIWIRPSSKANAQKERFREQRKNLGLPSEE